MPTAGFSVTASGFVGAKGSVYARGPLARHTVFFLLGHDTLQDTLLWLHPCGPTVDRLQRSTVGSGTREDVVTAFELTVLPEVVYIAPVPAVFASSALAALQHL